MKTLIVGLGVIGGAYAMKLSQAGYEVYGVDQEEQTIRYALQKKWILEGSSSAEEFLPQVDLLILAIYPQSILRFLNRYRHLFRSSLVITDVCGVKSSWLNEAVESSFPARYCSHHPMAGREKSGIAFADASVFEKANFLITPLPDTDLQAVEIIERLGKDLGFGKISKISAKDHDEMIGFTSQLTHAIAVSLVNSDSNQNTKDFIGDSYRDLTRIAMINDELWSELFLENKEILFRHIEHFETELDRLKSALKNDDREELKRIFCRSTQKRKEMEK